MSADMPCRRAAHREAAHADAIFVDGIMFADVFQGFECIDFADEFIGFAVTAIWMENERVGGSELAAIAFAVGDETKFAEFGIAAMIPEIETMLVIGRRIERGRNDEAVGLNGVVHFGFVAPDDKAGSGIPRHLAFSERAGAFGSLSEEFARGGKIVGAVENVVVERVANGVIVDLDIRQEIEKSGLGLERFLEVVDFVAE